MYGQDGVVGNTSFVIQVVHLANSDVTSQSSSASPYALMVCGNMGFAVNFCWCLDSVLF
jgi:hypothetical protein